MKRIKIVIKHMAVLALLPLLGILSANNTFAQDSDQIDWSAYATKWQVPPGARGSLIGGFLESVESGDESLLDAYSTKFAPQDPDGTASEIADLNKFLGGFELVDLMLRSETEIHIMLQPKGQDQAALVKLFLSDRSPLELTGFTVEPYESDQLEIPAFSSLVEVRQFLGAIEADDAFSGRVLIVNKGEEQLNEVYGKADRVSGLDNTLDTRFNIGSITKFLTEIAFGILHEEGRVDFNASIGTYIDSLPQHILDSASVKQVLEMEGGFGQYYSSQQYQDDPSAYRSIDDLMALIATMPLAFEPGTSKRYSNSGFIVLGAIVEAITGMTYQDYIQAAIFDPANMMDSGFYPHGSSEENNLAIPYSTVMSETDDPLDVRDDFGYRGNSAGGSYSTAHDLYLFDRALREGKYVVPATYNGLMAHMRAPGSPEPDNSQFAGRIGMAGGAQGVSAVYFSDFDNDIVVIVYANMDEPIGENIGSAIFRMMRNNI